MLERLRRIRQQFEIILLAEGISPNLTELELESIGFTDKVLRVWLQVEPDFPKRIVTPLNPKHRGNRASSEILYRGFFT